MNQFDPMIIEKILHQLKSQGIFDQFRKECMSDVDTKPAYQNLRQRVDGSVTGFLSTHTWRPDLNKNQLRDSLRKHIQNSGFLDMGVERIVDQVVNPKICPLFHPQVEEVVYDCLGVNKPGGPERLINNTTTKTVENSFRPRFSSEINKERKQKDVDDASITKIKPHTINETSLLPHDLEPVSPASEDRLVDTNEIEDFGDDEEISPPFEPHVDGNSDDSHLSESLQSNTFTIYRSKPETVNTDVHDYKNIENEDKTEKVELKTVDSVQRELVSDDDISVKENKGSNKGKTTKMYTILKNKSASDDICKKIFLKSDYFITCSDEERTANKVSKIKNYSQIRDSEITNGGTTNETDLNSQLCKKPNTDLKIKISNSGSYHHKKSQSGSSKYSENDYHNHHKHGDRKSNSHSRCHSGKTNNKLKYSKNSKQSEIKNVDKKEKYYKKHENIDTKHNTKVKSKDEKIKHVKTGHKNQIKDCVENINGIYLTKDHKDKQKEISDKHSEFKDHIESNREDTHIESKQDKHRCSGKSYSRFRKEDHSWNGNDKHIINEQLGITITVIKDDKKSTVRDKRRELSKIKHSKKHCKSNEKFKEGRRSSDRDSNGQGEGSSTTDNVSSHSQSQSQTSPEKDNISQSSNDTFVCDSVEYVEPVYSSYGSEYSITASKQDHKEESDKGDHKILALKSNIKKKHSNVYEVRKRIQARKSLERIRNKRTQAEIEKTVNNNTNFNKDRFDVKRPRLTEQNPAKDSGSILNRNNNNCENIEVITIIENEYTNKNFNDEDVDNFKRSENSIAMNSTSNKLQPNLKNTSSLKIKKHKKDPSIFEGKKSVNDLNRLVVISLDSNAENEYTNKNFNGDNVVLKPSECIVTINKLEPNFRNISSLTIKKHKKDSSIFRRNNSTNDLNRQENKNGTEIESKVKTHSKMESFDKEKMNEVSINQENEPDIMINNENFKNQDFALVKLNSANNISILPMTSDLKSNVPVIQSLIDMKKSHRKKPKVKSRRSEEYAKKKESSKKRCCSTRDSEAVTNSGQEHSTVHSKMIIGSNVDNCRQNKILKVINQDVRGEARFEEFTNPEKEPRYSIEVLEGDIFTQGYNTSQTDNEEYSDNKPIKLATKLMDVALQDLLMESGLSSACSTEEQERINKNSQHGCNSSGKKLKVSSEKPPTSHQQHYDKSDLYKPRPRFTQSSKRTRRCEVEPTSGDSSVQLPKLSYPISKR